MISRSQAYLSSFIIGKLVFIFAHNSFFNLSLKINVFVKPLDGVKQIDNVNWREPLKISDGVKSLDGVKLIDKEKWSDWVNGSDFEK